MKWLNDWEKEIDEQIAINDQEKKKAIADEKNRQKSMHVGDLRTFKFDKKALKNISKFYQEKKKKIDNKFLSRTTAEGLRVTLQSTIELTSYLLNSGDFKFVLIRKFNQDCLEVRI